MWKDHPSALPKARYSDYAHLPFTFGQQDPIKILPLDVKQSVIDSLERRHILCVKVRPNLTKAQIQDAISKAAMIYIKRPREEQNYYIFSKPIFSANKEYAYIEVDQSLRGNTYIFRYVAGKWVKIFEGWWIS